MSIKEASLLIILILFVVRGSFGAGNSSGMESTIKPQRINVKPMLLGGWEERDPNDREIQQLLPSVLMKVNEMSNDEHHLIPIKVLSVSSQVVAGMRHKLDVQVARSECKKNSNEKVNLQTCKKLEGYPDRVMTLEVWEKPWEDFLQVKILKTKMLS